MSSRDP